MFPMSKMMGEVLQLAEQALKAQCNAVGPDTYRVAPRTMFLNYLQNSMF